MISPSESKFRQATAHKKRFAQCSSPVMEPTVSRGAIRPSLCHSVRIRAQEVVQSVLTLCCQNALSFTSDREAHVGTLWFLIMYIFLICDFSFMFHTMVTMNNFYNHMFNDGL